MNRLSGSAESVAGQQEAHACRQKDWKVIIADDEVEVHNVTRMVLSDYEFEGRGLKFFSAGSAAETCRLISEHPDTAVLLLDVVMETDDAGLQAAHFIRNDLDNRFVRIILRTGQPGKAPEKDVIINYDINEYKEKTELTVQKLFTTITTALRSYRDLRTIEKNRLGLEQIIRSSGRLFETRSLKIFAQGVLTQLTSILRLDEDSVYVNFSGLSASEANESFTVLAGTGRYARYVDRSIDNIPEDVRHHLDRALKEKRSIFEDDIFVGYYASRSGNQNLLFLKSCRQLNKLDRDLIRIFSNNVAIAFDNIYLNQEIVDSHKEMLITIGEVVENRSREVGNHVRRVAEFSYLLALKAGRSRQEADLLKLVAPMHDVGKVAIPDNILFKPGRLTREEFEKIKTHAIIGYEIFKNSSRPIMKAAAIVAFQHHEHWDGTGYPNGLKGENIHIFGRIVGLADVFDSLLHWRIYKEKWALSQVIDLIRQQRGKRFDPDLVDIFMTSVNEFARINDQYADD